MPTVSGRVVFDINRNANIGGNIVGINNIPVALQNVFTQTALVVQTNLMGEYSFINVPAGNYRIVEAYGLAGGLPTPGDFNAASVMVIPPAKTPPVEFVTAVPPGATNIDCVTPNTILITVEASDILNQYIFNGPVKYTPLNASLDPCISVLPINLVLDADGGTLGGFPAGTLANTGPASNPYPAVLPDFTYVVPNPATYTPTDGQFTVQNTMNDAMSNVIGAWWRISDHTTGNETGRMMVVNEDATGDIIFRTTVAVQPNTAYLFSTWILNLFRTTGYSAPEFAVRILDERGSTLYNSHLGFEIPVSALYPEWKEIGSVINSVDNSHLVIEFFSQGKAAIGNDFAIDDIGFYQIILPEFDLVKTESRTTARVDDIVTYTTTLDNVCSQPLQDVRFFDFIPMGLEFVPGSVTVNGIPYPTANPQNGFFVPDITGAGTLTVSFEALVTAVPEVNPTVNCASTQYVYSPIEGGILNTYQLISNLVPLYIGAPADPTASADLAVTKSAHNGTVRHCETATFMLNVTNNGPDTATGVVLTDEIPCGLTHPHYSTDGGITWLPWSGELPLGDMANGASVHICLNATVGRGACTITKNTATVTSATTDPNPLNNSATARICVVPPAQCQCKSHCESHCKPSCESHCKPGCKPSCNCKPSCESHCKSHCNHTSATETSIPAQPLSQPLPCIKKPRTCGCNGRR